jgi:hypothetical protein
LSETEAVTPATLNALKHGLTAQSMVIPDVEVEHDWQTFYEGVITYYQPVGAVEYALADRAAGLLWRLRRVPRAERDATLNARVDDVTLPPHVIAMQQVAKDMEEMMGPIETADLDDEDRRFPVRGSMHENQPLFRALAAQRIRDRVVGTIDGDVPTRRARSLPEPLPLLALSRYEARLSGQLRHVIRELENCKALRERARKIPYHVI